MEKISEIQLSYSPQPGQPKVVRHSADAYSILLDSWDMKRINLQEEFKALLMNNAGHVLGIFPLTRGGMTATVVDVRLLFCAAIKSAATRMIVGHNHPSGHLRPSEQDIRLTHKILQGGKLLDIELLDHLIITESGYHSFRDEGMI